MQSPIKVFTKVVKYLESDCLNFVCYKIQSTSIGGSTYGLEPVSVSELVVNKYENRSNRG